MLDRLAPQTHLFRMFVEPALHRLENTLMFPSGDPSLLAGGATVLDGAALAGVGPVAAQDQSVFLGRVVVGEPFAGRTNVNVLLRHIAAVSYTHLRAHETVLDLVCRLLLEKKKK